MTDASLQEEEPHVFFSGNRFYTTTAGLISEGYLPEAITCGEVIAGCEAAYAMTLRKPPEHVRAALVITIVLPALLIAYAWFMNHRPPLHIKSEWTFQDTLIQNSDLILSFLFLIVSALPFYLVFDRKKVKARELTPIALMAALCVVGRAAFSLIPLPNFKPVSAIIIITALAFGPEAGYLTGALAAILSNFLFGQGPWTPWQMFCWGLVRISGWYPSVVARTSSARWEQTRGQ